MKAEEFFRASSSIVSCLLLSDYRLYSIHYNIGLFEDVLYSRLASVVLQEATRTLGDLIWLMRILHHFSEI